jgi:hypothetical protein
MISLPLRLMPVGAVKRCQFTNDSQQDTKTNKEMQRNLA